MPMSDDEQLGDLIEVPPPAITMPDQTHDDRALETSPEIQGEENQLPAPASPLIGRVAVAGVVILVLAAAVAGAVWIVPGLLAQYTSLDVVNPALIHPDGVAVVLAPNEIQARVRIDSIPREAFLQDLAGNRWTQAREDLPPYLTPLSPIYQIDVRQGNVVGEMSVPNGAEPLALVDLYQWDARTRQWHFVSSRYDPVRQLIQFSPGRGKHSVMAVHTRIDPIQIGMVVQPGGESRMPPADIAVSAGTYIDAAGQLVDNPAEVGGDQTLQLVENRQRGITDYSDPARQQMLIDQLIAWGQERGGVLLDFDNGPGYNELVSVLAQRLHAESKRLEIVVRAAELQGYDLALLSSEADRVWLSEPNPTQTLPNGPFEAALKNVVEQTDRTRLGLFVSAEHIELIGQSVTPLTFEEAAARFGQVQPVDGYVVPGAPLPPGNAFALRLTGPLSSMGYDESLRSNYITYTDGNGQVVYIYYSSAGSIARQLEWARQFGLGAVMVSGLATPDAPSGLAAGLEAFRNAQPLTDTNPALEIVWRVEASSGAQLEEQARGLDGIQYLWQAVADPGQYTISAIVREAPQESERGRVMVDVGDLVVMVTEEATGEPEATNTDEPTDQPTPTPGPTPTPAPVTGVIAGSFELGGQTHSFENPDVMRSAGMTWVKFQHKWGPGDTAASVADRVAKARAAGFKVLLAIPGPLNPQSIDFDAYVSFLGDVATLGPDAIEVWNEQNLSIEWPVGEIDGANYVNFMLKPAYERIKSVNPNIIVISGAPAPTGAFGGCSDRGCDDWFYIAQMRDAGAASYLDCVGVHYNEGIVPPSQRSGDPRAASDFYSRYFWGMTDLYYGTFGKPLCYTELGYVTGDGYPPLPETFAWASDTTVQEQAQWLAEAAILASQSGKVRMIIVFNIDIFFYSAYDPQGGYAIIRPDGSCPACRALAEAR